MGLSWAETRNFLLMIRGLLEVKSITIEIHDVGISLAERYQLSVYDSMIVSAALSAECDTLLSEDLQDGLLINGRLRLLNPFLRGTRSPHLPESKLLGRSRLHSFPINVIRRLSALARFFRHLLDVRGDAQVLPLSVGFHLREIILFHETDCVAAEQ
jgi:hypothetical protein